ncbi:MAG: hypothetical protein ACUVRY_07355 [Thermoanaerobaculaceae bacterium]
MARVGGGQLLLGLVLTAFGVALLLARMHVVAYAPALLLALGAALSLFGVFTGRLASLVPGCVLLGLGFGFFWGQRAYHGVAMVKWPMAGLGLGFLLIFLLSWILALGRQLWALVVGLILLAVATLPNLKGWLPPDVVIAIRTFWPVVLVALGLYLVVRGLRH